VSGQPIQAFEEICARAGAIPRFAARAMMTVGPGRASGPVGITAVADRVDLYLVLGFLDAVDDAVRPPTCEVVSVERVVQRHNHTFRRRSFADAGMCPGLRQEGRREASAEWLPPGLPI
jgi:hypothetical protein